MSSYIFVILYLKIAKASASVLWANRKQAGETVGSLVSQKKKNQEELLFASKKITQVQLRDRKLTPSLNRDTDSNVEKRYKSFGFEKGIYCAYIIFGRTVPLACDFNPFRSPAM